ncbi:hypothetical protein niasHS_010246 [Heterodera schachtii]|uniref:CBS domain-containing protein n=1 Tax=Heterodera schachtii TaxID=97005 RepID=A0ABD2IZ55_HETSC
MHPQGQQQKQQQQKQQQQKQPKHSPHSIPIVSRMGGAALSHPHHSQPYHHQQQQWSPGAAVAPVTDFGPSSAPSVSGSIIFMPSVVSGDNAGGGGMGSSSTSEFSSRMALLIRDNSSFSFPTTPVDSPPSLGGSVPEINRIIFESQEAVYSLFMKAHKCYDIIPTSSKLVVFDTELPVSKAFFALVYNGVRAAPLFDSKSQEFIGMLTITDFIQILHKYYKNDQIDNGMKQLEEHKISTWREIFREENSVKSFITIDPLESLHKAAQLLCEHKIHRLPVLEHSTGNILYILTHKRLIKFLYLYINDLPRPPFMDKTPKELGIGSWGDICTISKDTPLIEAMKIFLAKRVSALPLLDSDGRVVDIYAKFDAINLAADKTYDKLDVTVFEALQQRSEWFEGVRKCSEKDSLMTVIDVIVKAEVHRLVVVDDDNHVVGIISLSDILSHLVLEPPSSPGGGGGTERSSRVASAAETSNEGPATQSPAAVDEAAKEMMDFSLG